MLGLAGTVDKFSFERLCDNRNPMTGEPLTVRTRCERTVGYDFTFSVPKSVSLLYAISGDQDILEAFRAAVVPERKLVTEASKRGLGVVTVEGVTNEVRERPLIRSDITGRRMAPVA